MRIEEYFRRVQQIVELCPFVQVSSITYDRRSTYEGFIRGEIYIIDGSILHLREFMDVETRIERLTYVYQYMDTNGNLVFRYDNTGHHKKLGLQTYPHHKHDGGEGNVVASSAPDLAEVLDEIEGQVQLPQE